MNNETKFISTILMNLDISEKIVTLPNICLDKKNKELFDTIKYLVISGIDVSFESITTKNKNIDEGYLNALIKNDIQSDLFDVCLNEQMKTFIDFNLGKIHENFKLNKYTNYIEMVQDIEKTNINLISEDDTKTMQDLGLEYIKKQNPERKKTGFDGIDYYGGLPKSCLVIIGARPSVGKSSLMAQMILNDDKFGFKVGVLSLEMFAIDIYQKMIANRTLIDENDIDLKKFNEHPSYESEIARFIEDHMQSPIYWNDNPDLDIDGICRLIKKWDYKYNLDKYYIDYLQWIPCYKNFPNETEKTKYVIQKLARLKKQINKNIFVLAQLNRESEKGNETRPPKLSDLKQSGQIEQDADIVLLLHEDKRIDAKNSEIQIIIAKGRKMPKGIINCKFRKDLSKFIEINQEYK